MIANCVRKPWSSVTTVVPGETVPARVEGVDEALCETATFVAFDSLAYCVGEITCCVGEMGIALVKCLRKRRCSYEHIDIGKDMVITNIFSYQAERGKCGINFEKLLDSCGVVS